MKKTHLSPAKQSLKKRVRKQQAPRLYGFLTLFLAISLLELFFLFDYTEKSFNRIGAVCLYLILILLPAFFLKIPSLLFDFPWEGTVEDIRYDSFVDSHDIVGMKYTSLYHAFTATLTVRKDNGKKVVFDIRLSRSDEELPYRIGDRIRRYRGTKYPVLLDTASNRPRVCALCGKTVPADQTPCSYCRADIVRE